MDLKYLTPLWNLYKTMTEDHGYEQTSALHRALTELFFIAENVAMVCIYVYRNILGSCFHVESDSVIMALMRFNYQILLYVR